VGKESPSVVSTSSPSINFGSEFADLTEFEEVQLINREQLLQQDLVYTPWKVQPSWQLTVDEAVNYFLRHNVWPGAIFMMNFEPKSPGHPSATLSEQAQMAALVSVGTAMLSRVRRSKDLEIAAEREYGHALSLLTRAVCNEEQSRTNSTLSAVLLLAIFEVRHADFTINLLSLETNFSAGNYQSFDNEYREMDKSYIWSCHFIRATRPGTSTKRGRAQAVCAAEVSDCMFNLKFCFWADRIIRSPAAFNEECACQNHY
jgi:hypothetical protein